MLSVSVRSRALCCTRLQPLRCRGLTACCYVVTQASGKLPDLDRDLPRAPAEPVSKAKPMVPLTKSEKIGARLHDAGKAKARVRAGEKALLAFLFVSRRLDFGRTTLASRPKKTPRPRIPDDRRSKAPSRDASDASLLCPHDVFRAGGARPETFCKRPEEERRAARTL